MVENIVTVTSFVHFVADVTNLTQLLLLCGKVFKRRLQHTAHAVTPLSISSGEPSYFTVSGVVDISTEISCKDSPSTAHSLRNHDISINFTI